MGCMEISRRVSFVEDFWRTDKVLILHRSLGKLRNLLVFSTGKVGYFSVVLECSGRKKSNGAETLLGFVLSTPAFADIFIVATAAWIIVYFGH